jgi:hypothetical protein
MIVVIYSNKWIDTFESSLQRNRAGESLVVYVLPPSSSPAVFCSPGLSVAAGKVFLNTCQNANSCLS